MKSKEQQIEKSQNDTTVNIASPLEQNGWKDIGSLEREVWKDIVDYEGSYQVSNKGNVKSLDRITKTKNNKKILYVGKLLNPPVNNKGYKLVALYKNSKAHGIAIHRLVAQAFIPYEVDKLHVNHKDGNKLNNNTTNLEWVTPKENTRHAIANKLMTFDHLNGERNGRSKLEEYQIKEIRYLYYTTNISNSRLGERFDVTAENIWNIVNYKSWSEERSSYELFLKFLENPIDKRPSSENNGNTSLTRKEVDEIKYMVSQRIMVKDVAKKFNITRQTVTNITKGRTWAK